MEQENFSVLFDLPAAPEQKKLDIDKKKWDLKWVWKLLFYQSYYTMYIITTLAKTEEVCVVVWGRESMHSYF